MKLVIDDNGLVSDVVALQTVLEHCLNKPDCTVLFKGGLAVEIKTAKTQRSFKFVKRELATD